MMGSLLLVKCDFFHENLNCGCDFNQKNFIVKLFLKNFLKIKIILHGVLSNRKLASYGDGMLIGGADAVKNFLCLSR
ncbi:hypothetical protein C5470_17245 [Photorhabdus stackebrandtii]|uniref:Uncharacterized protein n=1 Tax=Photorhabdus stackebrandtii TaxID=1123042 RepID=A0A7X5TMR1_9GAMM|nr:hypothetical protein [Photorhabdus stackebrandtii]